MNDLRHAILDVVLPRQVPDAEVLLPAQWPGHALSPQGLDPLPDTVAYSSGMEMLFIIQFVGSVGAPDAKRHAALLRWSSAFRGKRVCVWAYATRKAYAMNMGDLLSNTMIWFADEPEHAMYVSGSAKASAEYMKARFAVRR